MTAKVSCIRELNKDAIGRVALTNRDTSSRLELMDKGLMGMLLHLPY
jgi:hypothetical protein